MLESIRVPMFMVATEADHVAPGNRPQGERAHDLAGVHFLLTGGGHNVGIVSGPVHPKRRHRVRTLRGGERRYPWTSG
jgi:polyhydroxyalkanoate synthase